MERAWPGPGRLSGRPSPSCRLRELRRVVSYHRFLLDAHLEWASPVMSGTVVDLGGKREGRRGTFRPMPEGRTRWIVVNRDPAAAPHVLCDVAAVPLQDAVADCVLCTEVLEHVPDPAACVREAARLLPQGGVMVASVPFLYPVHPDPQDFHRFAPDGLRQLFAPFSQVEILQMGGYLGTIGSLVELGARHSRSAGVVGSVLYRVLFEMSRGLAWCELRRGRSDEGARPSGLTTGYFVVATK